MFWVPSIAISGLSFYTGDRFPEWKGNAFVGSLFEGRTRATGHVQRITFTNGRPIQREPILTELRGAAGTLGSMRTSIENIKDDVQEINKKIEEGRYDVQIVEVKAIANAAKEATAELRSNFNYMIAALIGTLLASLGALIRTFIIS